MHALNYQNTSTLYARLPTAVIVLALIAIVSGVLATWADIDNRPSTRQIQSVLINTSALLQALENSGQRDSVEAALASLVSTTDRYVHAIAIPKHLASENASDPVRENHRRLLSRWEEDINPALQAFVARTDAQNTGLQHTALLDQQRIEPRPQMLLALHEFRSDLLRLDSMLSGSTAVSFSVFDAILYTTLLALLAVTMFVRRAWITRSPLSRRPSVAGGRRGTTHSTVARVSTAHHAAPAQVEARFELLQDVLSGLISNPESPQPFLRLLREVEELIDANCSAIFITRHPQTTLLPLVCTEPAERERFIALLENGLTAASPYGRESIQLINDPNRDDARIILVRLRVGNKASEGVLLLKTRSSSNLSAGEVVLLENLGEDLAGIICSTQRAQMNQRLALYEERAVIARELHDSLAQSLSYLKIQAGRLQKLLGSNESDDALEREDTDAVLQELRSHLDLAYRQLRELITTFRLTMNGRTLGQAVKDSVEEFESRSSIAFTLDNRIPDGMLSVDEEMQVLQIMRECIHNIVRHAHARSAEVSLYAASSGTVRLTIDDDGIGLDATRRDQHHGLVIMQQRAHSLGGDMRLSDRSNGGTRVQVVFPARGPNTGAGANESTRPV